MRYINLTKKAVYVLFCLALCTAAGCNQDLDKVKSQTDDDVYTIIEKKWDAKFGLRANFKIKDAEPTVMDFIIDANPPASGVLSLPRAVAIATANNRQYQIEKELLYLKTIDFIEIRHTYEYLPYSLFDASYSKTEDDSSTGGSATVGIQRLLASGAQIGAQLTAGWFNIVSGDTSGNGLGTILDVTLIQPLLRGSDRKAVLENLTQADRDVLYQIRTFNRFRQTFVVDTVSLYYQVLELDETQKIADQYYLEMDKLYRQCEPLVKVGKILPHDMEEITQEKLRAMDDYTIAKREYEQLMDQFKLHLAVDPSMELQLDSNELQRLYNKDISMVRFNVEEALMAARSQRLDLANAGDMVIDAQRKIEVAADAIRAGANIVASASHTKEPGQPADYEYSLGVQLEPPWDRTIEKAEYRRAQVLLDQQNLLYSQTFDTIQVEVRNAYQKLNEASQRQIISSSALSLSEKRKNKTTSLLPYARASVRDVMRAYEDYYQARLDAADALTDYVIATISFYNAAGSLQVKPDGMWQSSLAASSY